MKGSQFPSVRAGGNKTKSDVSLTHGLLLGPPWEYWEEEVVFQPPWSEPVSKVSEQGELPLQSSTQTRPALQTSPQLNMPTWLPGSPLGTR